MITTYIIYFFVLSAAGYVYETIAMTIWGGKWDNRGFFYGPLIPIYGAGALGGTLLFTYFIHDNTPLKVFLIGMIASAVLEYSVHYVLERIFHQVWWDYSKSIWNINGRICLPASVGFGVAGVLIIFVINPWLIPLILKMSSAARTGISLVLIGIFVLDFIFTVRHLKGENHALEKRYESFNRIMDRQVGKVINESMALNKKVYVIFDKIDHRNRASE
ncbi:MAG: putative ABC transporter permease [Erysipelotrichaceae bacterium]|nr:putative ABC transporter permease [Erysipelotrichaceae bacterium]